MKKKNTNLGFLPAMTLSDVRGRIDFSHNEAIATVVYETREECLTAVKIGLVDLAVCDNFSGSILMQLSLNDQLTGLYNRTTAKNHICQLLHTDHNHYIGLMIILDIDHFKNFNDEFGHLCGDDVLRSFGGFAQADEALYQAKKNGRSQLCLANT